MNVETIKTKTVAALKTAAHITATATVATAGGLWVATLWLLAATWAVAKWAGRMTLWIFCWPLGLWRSWRKGEDRRNAKLAAAIVQAEQDRKAA